MTINISLPTHLYKEIKTFIARRGYASFSEFFREAARNKVYPELTENGFTSEFEEAVLRAAKEPRDESKVWKTEKDIDEYFEKLRKELKLKRKNGQN